MTDYEKQIVKELLLWQADMQSHPSLFGRATKGIQVRINKMIPEKVHKIITTAIEQMTRTVIFGADIATTWPQALRKTKPEKSIEKAEARVKKRIKFYRSAAAAEGAATGFGGIFWGFADLPLWLSIKMKMMFEIAFHYGLEIKDYKERIYILYIFQLTFSSQQHRNKIYEVIADWENQNKELPENFDDFDWRTFQLEYRDFLDLAKLLQMIPGFGAIVGAYINHRFTDRLGKNAINAYRMRLLNTTV